jgi:hypothetical protein
MRPSSLRRTRSGEKMPVTSRSNSSSPPPPTTTARPLSLPHSRRMPPSSPVQLPVSSSTQSSPVRVHHGDADWVKDGSRGLSPSLLKHLFRGSGGRTHSSGNLSLQAQQAAKCEELDVQGHRSIKDRIVRRASHVTGGIKRLTRGTKRSSHTPDSYMSNGYHDRAAVQAAVARLGDLQLGEVGGHRCLCSCITLVQRRNSSYALWGQQQQDKEETGASSSSSGSNPAHVKMAQPARGVLCHVLHKCDLQYTLHTTRCKFDHQSGSNSGSFRDPRSSRSGERRSITSDGDQPHSSGAVNIRDDNDCSSDDDDTAVDDDDTAVAAAVGVMSDGDIDGDNDEEFFDAKDIDDTPAEANNTVGDWTVTLSFAGSRFILRVVCGVASIPAACLVGEVLRAAIGTDGSGVWHYYSMPYLDNTSLHWQQCYHM